MALEAAVIAVIAVIVFVKVLVSIEGVPADRWPERQLRYTTLVKAAVLQRPSEVMRA